MVYRTKGTCSQAINVEAENGIVTKLVVGMKVDDVINRLEGTTCGPRPTSCPDQLAKALKQLKSEQQ